MSIEAMKQAVKALEFAAGLISPITKGCQCQICLAHKALRQAIEQAEKPKTRPATREEKIVNPGVYEVAVHANDISQTHVDETAKDRHEFECPRCGHCCQQREWVGLDGDIPGLGLVTEEFYNGMVCAEEILKEKNT